MKKQNTNAVRFTVNFITKEIIGTNASFNKASTGFGPIYEELAEKVAKHPDFKLVVKEQKKHTTKAKKTYDGLDFKMMEDFISIQKDSEQTMKKYKAVKKAAKDAGRSVYPITKKWFLEVYENFDVEEAKAAIRDAMIAGADKSVSETETPAVNLASIA